ncbi:MAG: prephenate dehydrogenase/arogenate dehydrogenase family protein [Desulfurococcales archaeon]|nr:prephenate dehydrogenase/arogenate dehydrogenase family protein [Desulfurococcales archaeon]
MLGAAGRIGTWLVKLLLSEGFYVIASDVNGEGLRKLRMRFPRVVTTRSNREAVAGARIVLLAVPIENFEEVVKEVKPCITSEHLVIDVCSVKEEPVRIMHEYLREGVKLGAHPLFGPGARMLVGKKVVLTPTTAEERDVALRIGAWLRSRGARAILMSPREHDEYMRVALGLTHFIGVLLVSELSQYNVGGLKEVSGPSLNVLLTFASSLLDGNLELTVMLQRYLNVREVAESFMKKGSELLRKIEEEPQAVVRELIEIRDRLSKSGIDPLRSVRETLQLL